MLVLLLRLILAAEFLFTALYCARDILRTKMEQMAGSARYVKNALIGFVTDFFDTLGIGCFAPTMFAWKVFGGLPKDAQGNDRDDLVPGTLNVGHTLPVITEALLFLGFVEVEPLTLLSLLAAACLGGILGAGWVSRLPVNAVRIALAFCLYATAVVVIMRQFSLGPYAGVNEALLGLHGLHLFVAVAVNFLLGVLMNLGFGLYAPCMGMLLALGMDVGAIFPIMMGSTAIQMPFSSAVFIREGKYDPKATVMLAVFGVLGVLFAYFLVKSMDITVLLYIVILVMLYTATRYLLEGLRGRKAQ